VQCLSVAAPAQLTQGRTSPADQSHQYSPLAARRGVTATCQGQGQGKKSYSESDVHLPQLGKNAAASLLLLFVFVFVFILLFYYVRFLLRFGAWGVL
jgi:hypothetical protein